MKVKVKQFCLKAIKKFLGFAKFSPGIVQLNLLQFSIEKFFSLLLFPLLCCIVFSKMFTLYNFLLFFLAAATVDCKLQVCVCVDLICIVCASHSQHSLKLLIINMGVESEFVHVFYALRLYVLVAARHLLIKWNSLYNARPLK